MFSVTERHPGLDFLIVFVVFNHVSLWTCLRTAFEFEKKTNAEQLEQRQAMEQNLLAVARDLEKLKTEAANAEKRTRVNPGNWSCDVLI